MSRLERAERTGAECRARTTDPARLEWLDKIDEMIANAKAVRLRIERNETSPEVQKLIEEHYRDEQETS